MSRWPAHPRVESPHLAPNGTLEALYSADLPNRETAHREFVSVPATDGPVWGRVCWGDLLPVQQVWVRFRPGWRPTAWRLGLCGADGVWRWQPGPTDADGVAVATHGALARGVAVAMDPEGGPAGQPPVLRVAALAPQIAGAPGSPIEVERDGARHAPRLPLATDGSGWTHLDIGDSDALWITPPGPITRLTLTLRRLGSSGDADAVRRWLGQPGPVTAAGEAVPVTVRLDTSAAGWLAGRARVHLQLAHPVSGPLRLVGAPRPRALWLVGLGFEQTVVGEPLPPAPPVPVDTSAACTARFEAAGRWTLAAAGQGAAPVHHALSLMCPGVAPAAGGAGDGRLAVPWPGGHTAALHLGFAQGGAALPVPTRALDPRSGCLRQRWPGVQVSAWVDAAAPPALCVQWAAPAGGLSMALAAAEGGRPLAPRWRVEQTARGTALWAADRCVLQAPGGAEIGVGPDEVRVHLPGRGGRVWVALTAAGVPAAPLGIAALRARVRAALPARAEVRLPGPWQARLEGALTQAAGFAVDGRLAYGRWPSVYHGDVFGLEEDYLAQGVAQWGAADTGLGWLCATYLTDTHLDPRHYLYDLRAGLTPWQVARALARAGRGWGDLSAEAQGHLLACGAWTVAQCAQTADADGRVGPGGVRVFPGCLPRTRYGGDLGFPTQSLYLSVIHAAGLRALGALTGDVQWAQAGDALLAASRAALAAVATADTQPLHSGGADPGQYHQLMACGLLMPVEALPDDDPILQRLDAQLEREGRLFWELPRFDGWGAAPGIDGVYALGWLLRALRQGDRPRFWRGLLALSTWARDDAVGTWREVGPIRTAPQPPEPLVPGRRLSQSEPCLGSLGVWLQLVRHAFVTPLLDARGQATGVLRVGAGLLPGWWDAPCDLLGLRTLAGPVSLRLRRGRWWIDAPGCAGLEVFGPDGRLRARLPAGTHTVPL